MVGILRLSNEAQIKGWNQSEFRVPPAQHEIINPYLLILFFPLTSCSPLTSASMLLGCWPFCFFCSLLPSL